MTNLKEKGFERKMAYVKMFVKPDRWPADIVSQKPPRAIQYRSAEFNLMLASYLMPVEHKIYEMIKPHGTRVVAKGLNLRQRAELVQEKLKNFSNPQFINLDHSKFDSTVNITHLKELHRIYRKLCGKKVQNYLQYQYRNRGFTKHGIKYTSKATRCSGDFDTGLGNTLINIACILEVFHKVKHDFILDGDDAVIIVERGTQIDVANFEKFGFQTVLEVVDNIEQIDFCHGKIIDNEGWVFSRDPIRAISNQMACRKAYDVKGMARYLAGVGKCELACSAGVPILQAWGQRLASYSDKPLMEQDVEWKMRSMAPNEKVKEITPQARLTFEKAWNISPALQIAIEDMLLPKTPCMVNKCKDACSGVTESFIFNHDYEQLYEAWQRMATMGDPSSPSWGRIG